MEKQEKFVLASDTKKVLLRISYLLADKVEALADELNISINDAYKMVIKAGIKTFI